MILRRPSAALRTARETIRLSPWTSGDLNRIHGHLSPRQRERCRSQLFHSLRCTTTRSLVLVTCICAFAPMTVLAWLYPEHRSITFLAIKMLGTLLQISCKFLVPAERSFLRQGWQIRPDEMRDCSCGRTEQEAVSPSPNVSGLFQRDPETWKAVFCWI